MRKLSTLLNAFAIAAGFVTAPTELGFEGTTNLVCSADEDGSVQAARFTIHPARPNRETIVEGVDVDNLIGIVLEQRKEPGPAFSQQIDFGKEYPNSDPLKFDQKYMMVDWLACHRANLIRLRDILMKEVGEKPDEQGIKLPDIKRPLVLDRKEIRDQIMVGVERARESKIIIHPTPPLRLPGRDWDEPPI